MKDNILNIVQFIIILMTVSGLFFFVKYYFIKLKRKSLVKIVLKITSIHVDFTKVLCIGDYCSFEKYHIWRFFIRKKLIMMF